MKLLKLSLLLILVLALCACAPRNGFVRDEDALSYYLEGKQQSFDPGVRTIDGKAYLVLADGVSLCAETGGPAAVDGALYWFEEDSSLKAVTAGLNQLPNGLYYAEADGFTLCRYADELVQVGDVFYAFDESSRVRTFTPGIHELYGKTYLVGQEGSTMTEVPPAEEPPVTEKPPVAEAPPVVEELPVVEETPAIEVRTSGMLYQDGQLYCVNEDGSLLTNASVGYLTFDENGRYTSGNAELDEAVRGVLAACITPDMTDREQMFRAAYTYLRDNYRYLSMDLYAAGTTDWAEASALKFFQLGKGNCYCWAAAVMYCGRQLGYQTYVVSGWESTPTNVHAWTMAQWDDGNTYLFDAELEYAYWYMYANKPRVDMFKISGSGIMYNGFAYYFPQ